MASATGSCWRSPPNSTPLSSGCCANSVSLRNERLEPPCVFRMHRDHEPRTGETAPPRCCRHLAGSAFLRLGCRQEAGSTLRVHSKPPFVFLTHCDHEPDLHKSLNDQ